VIIHLTIDKPTESPNELLRMHWSKRRKLQKDYDNRVLLAIGQAGVIIEYAEEGERRRVIIERHGWSLLDPDNLTGSVKLLVDALRHTRLLWDDTAKCLDLAVVQGIDRKRPRTEIFIIYGGLNGKKKE